MKRAFLLMFLTILILPVISIAQEREPVFVERGLGGLKTGCFLSNEIVNRKHLAKIRENENCRKLLPQDVDFENKTLITYSVSGDCRMRVETSVTLERKNKVYTVNTTNYWGRCRAGGNYGGWLVVKKIPSDHTVSFVETKSDLKLNTPLRLAPGIRFRSNVDFKEVDMKGCIFLGINQSLLVTSKRNFLALARKDAQSPTCKTIADKFDFQTYSLIGANISTGYCKKPEGLFFAVNEYSGSDLFVVEPIYFQPKGVCRALSKHSFWLRVPRKPRPYSLLIKKRPQRRPVNGEG